MNIYIVLSSLYISDVGTLGDGQNVLSNTETHNLSIYNVTKGDVIQ